MKRIIFTLALTIAFLTNSQKGRAQFKIVGYVPNWVNLTSFSTSFDYSRVTHLNIAFKDPDASGNLPSLTSGEIALINAAHTHGVGVLLSLCGGSSSESSSKRTIYFGLINAANRSVFASKLKQYVLNNNLDGIDLDLEGPAINSDYGSFVQVLADSLHPEGKLITSALSVGYGGGNVPNSTFAYFDWINIMAYDAKGPWSPSDAGQHSPYQMAVDALSYWKGRGLAKEKAILGVPFYGYEFGPSSPSSSAVSYKSIVTSFPDAANDDEVASGGGNTIYYNGISTIIDKTSLALLSGGGIMIWELSLDATGDNSLLKVIREVAGTAVTEVKSSALESNTSVYPNPTSGPLTILEDFKNIKLELYNTMGEKIQSFSEVSTIDMSNFPKGIYYLHIIKEENIRIKKIVLQ